MNKYPACILIFFGFSLALFSQTEKVIDPKGPAELFEQVLTGNAGIDYVRHQSDLLLNDQPDPLLEVRIIYFQGVMETYLPGGSGGTDYFLEAERRIERIDPEQLSLEERSEWYRIYADILNRLIIDMNPFKALAASSRIRRYAGKALELDPGNTRAEITLIAYMYHAPAIAGGDKKQAVATVNSCLSGLSGRKEDRHIEYILRLWQLIMSSDSGDNDNAARAEAYINMLYPPNPFLTGFITKHLN